MTLRLKLFASLRERAGASDLDREFAPGVSVGEVWRALTREFPALLGQDEALSFAVNREYVKPDFRPCDGDEVAFIPPVSGGAGGALGPIRIVRSRIDVAALEAAVADPGAGAIATFVGTTRNENSGRRVLRLEYEAYEPMALSEMRKLAEEAARRWRITRAAVTHRIGVVEVGEASVAIAVSAPHRAEAFAACRFLIDRIKEIVPIWKKEHFEGGEIWVGCQTSHPPHVHQADH
jgi:molybdopterin synthase catalytic subunit/molybdopterin converting factor small subunit